MGEVPKRGRARGDELDRGSLGVRPWGRVLADLARRDFTGTIRVDAGDRRYEIGFLGGHVVTASSPVPADAAVRIAVKQRMIQPARMQAVADAVARVMRRPGGGGLTDEVEVVARAAQLSGQEAIRLRAQVLVQRAARTFELEDGVFVILDTAPGDTLGEVDVREVVQVGARLFAPHLRLLEELRTLGDRFKLEADTASLSGFVFGDTCAPVLAALQTGASLAELDAFYRDLDPRTVHAIVYALVTCGVARASRDVRAPASTATAPLGRATVGAGTRDRRPFVEPGKLSARTRTPTTRQDMYVPQLRTPAPPLARAPTVPAPSSSGPDLGRAPTQTATRARRASSESGSTSGSKPDGSA